MSTSRMSGARVLVATTAAIDEHDTGPAHPERSARLTAVAAGIGDAHIDDAVSTILPRSATPEEMTLVHDDAYLEALLRFTRTGGNLDPDTPVVEGSWPTARYAAGTGLAAITALQRGEGDAAFVALRPPGHHASRAQAMGFCLLNNAAIGAAALAAGGERVLILDWDVHHGNGTQNIFWDDPRVLYASIHQWPAYPGTGRASEIGGPHARGLTVNVPLPPGSTGDAAMAALDDVVAGVVDDFRPTWVLISAGYDAHRDDPLAELSWSAGDYGALTSRVLEFAPGPGRVVFYLEGGYDLFALRRSVGATVSVLGGQPWVPEPRTGGGAGREAVAQAAMLRARALEGGSP